MLTSFKVLVKNFIGFIFIKFGFIKRAKKKIIEQNAIVSIYFHNPSMKTFHDCIKWLIEQEFQFIDTNDILKLPQNISTLNKPRVIITIDDGWRNNLLNIVPIAHFNKIPITIFITTEPLIEGGGYWWSYVKVGQKKELTSCTIPFLKSLPNTNRLSILNRLKSMIFLERESMTVEELRAIATSPYIHIGAHTVTHPILTNCSDEIARSEIVQSKSVLDAILPFSVSSFSYPNGDYTEREVSMLKNNGYKMSFTTKSSLIQPNMKIDFFRLPRFEVLDNASYNENICRMMGVWF